MISVPFAHIAGIPIEESLAPAIPAIALAVGVVSATLRSRLRRHRPSTGHDGPRDAGARGSDQGVHGREAA